MKTVHNPENVAHLFANRSQSEARNSGRTLFFSRETIYSYGYHFPIAKHVENKQGEKALLFTTRSYSNTTAKHIWIVYRASNNLNIIKCYNPEFAPAENMDQFERAVKLKLSNLATARKPAKYILEAEQVREQAVKFAKFYGLNTKNIDKLIDAAKSGKYAEQLKKEAAAQKRKEAAAEKRRQKEFKESLNKWRAFDQQKLYGREFGVDYLRYNTEKARIETSQGVEIPVEIAKRAFQWIKQTKQCNGCEYSILDYKVSELTPEFIKIGCHKIELTEINLLAASLFW